MSDDGFRQQAEALLQRAEVTPAEAWQVTESEHRTLIELVEAFDPELPLATFRSPKGVATFLRSVLGAKERAKPR
jgi:hypothetical protein